MSGLFLFIILHCFSLLCFVVPELCVRKDFMVVYNILIIGEWHTCLIHIYPLSWIPSNGEKDLRTSAENTTYPGGKSYFAREKNC